MSCVTLVNKSVKFLTEGTRSAISLRRHQAAGDDPERTFLSEAAALHGIDVRGLTITRVGVWVGPLRLSALRYAQARAPTAPPLALVHGGGQNAHTWDLTVAALGLDAVAVDLPGHGSSDWLDGHDYSPRVLAGSLTEALRALCPDLQVLVGMSLGGMVAVSAAGSFPALRQLVTVDVSPGSVLPPSSTVAALAELGPAPFEELVSAVTARSRERRLDAALRHGVWHNTEPVPGGRVWRRDPDLHVGSFLDLWPEYLELAPRLAAVVAERGSFVPPGDLDRIDELLGDRVHRIAGATHSVQSTRPVELAAVLRAAASQ